MENNEEYCMKLLLLYRQFRCSMHHHKKKKETFFVISGKVLLEFADGETILLTPGMHQTIERKRPHRFTGLSMFSYIIECSTQHFEDDSYRITLSDKLSDEEYQKLKEKYDKEKNNEY